MITWEDTLPSPGWSSYAYAPATALTRTPMEKGPDRVRRLRAAVIVDYTVPFQFDGAQMETFLDLYRNDLRHGTEPFLISLRTGFGVAQHEIFHLQVKSCPRQGPQWWTPVLTMRTLTRNMLTADEAEFYTYYSPEDVQATLDPLHVLLHQSLPGDLIW